MSVAAAVVCPSDGTVCRFTPPCGMPDAKYSEPCLPGKEIETPKTHDPVNHPAHYTAGSVECIDAIRASLGDEAFVAYCRGQAIKYAWRAGLKAAHAEDLRKGAWYLTKAASVLDA